MNERIKQLALRAEKTVKSQYPNDEVNIGVARMMDVFAVLIVRECANFIDSHGGVDEYGQATDIVYGVDLMKHFGVKE